MSLQADRGTACRLSDELAERLLRRFLGALAAALEPGERLEVRAEAAGATCRVSAGRPRRLNGDAAALLGTAALDSSDALALDLRLVRGLARIAGGDLLIDERRLTLSMPAPGD